MKYNISLRVFHYHVDCTSVMSTRRRIINPFDQYTVVDVGYCSVFYRYLKNRELAGLVAGSTRNRLGLDGSGSNV